MCQSEGSGERLKDRPGDSAPTEAKEAVILLTVAGWVDEDRRPAIDVHYVRQLGPRKVDEKEVKISNSKNKGKRPWSHLHEKRRNPGEVKQGKMKLKKAFRTQDCFREKLLGNIAEPRENLFKEEDVS